MNLTHADGWYLSNHIHKGKAPTYTHAIGSGSTLRKNQVIAGGSLDFGEGKSFPGRHHRTFLSAPPLMLAETSVLRRVGRSPEVASVVSQLRSEGLLWTCDIVTLELGYSADTTVNG